MKVAIYTLGCKTNQFESQALEAELLKRGHALGGFDEVCDCYVINSCTVTASGGKKSRNAVRRARKLNERAVVALTGCFPQASPEEAALMTEADIIVGTGSRAELPDLLEATFNRRAPRTVQVDDASLRRDFERLGAGGLSSRTRALLKVQDGCDNRCAYCVIPLARGPVRSLPQAEAEAEALRLSLDGYREIVVTGIEVSSYGIDLPGNPDFASLVRGICLAAPESRIRLGSLWPTLVDEGFAGKLSDLENLCPHFHLSLQSGCDETLSRMGRSYGTERFLRSVHTLRHAFPDCGVTADLIVGFPGESAREFEKTLEFIALCGFSDMHIFPYSRRKGTRADLMDGQIARAEKEYRASRARAAADASAALYRGRFAGRTLRVLFEEASNGRALGYSENYLEVSVPKEGAALGEVFPVKITSALGRVLEGEIVR